MPSKGTKQTKSPRRCKRWRDKILEYIALGMGVRESCDLTGISNTLVYRELRSSDDFRKKWEDAIDRSVVILEAEAVKRAASHSDFLLWKLLQARAKGRYGDAGIMNADAARRIELDIKVRDEETNAD